MPASKLFTAYPNEQQMIEMGVGNRYIKEGISVCAKQDVAFEKRP